MGGKSMLNNSGGGIDYPYYTSSRSSITAIHSLGMEGLIYIIVTLQHVCAICMFTIWSCGLVIHAKSMLFTQRGNILMRRFKICNDDVKFSIFQSYLKSVYSCQLWTNYNPVGTWTSHWHQNLIKQHQKIWFWHPADVKLQISYGHQ